MLKAAGRSRGGPAMWATGGGARLAWRWAVKEENRSERWGKAGGGETMLLGSRDWGMNHQGSNGDDGGHG